MLLEQLILTSAVIAVFVTVLFVISIPLRRNDIADIAWSIGIFVVALVSYLSAETVSTLMVVLLALATLWSGRLSLRIFLRNRQKPEDYRYKKWREEWGKWFYPRSYLQVYLLQGVLMLIVGYSFIHASVFGGGVSFGIWQYVGLSVWLIGYFFEVVGDWQLDQFLKQPNRKEKVMQHGLWKYSRHPNYFGEVTMWWGIWLMLVTLPFGLWTFVSPLTITFLILKISGIPMLEARFAGDPQFESYKRRTSTFFPLPPKQEVESS